MKKRVLVAEDDLPLRAFMDEALYFLGYQVVAEADGAAALRRLDTGNFDIVITDHRMPEMDGLTLVRELRARRYAGRIYVISGEMPSEAWAEYGRLQVDGIGIKPMKINDLHRMLRGQAAA
jgi:two-component system, chemotaxis family, chemotaxis protein CheY